VTSAAGETSAQLDFPVALAPATGSQVLFGTASSPATDETPSSNVPTTQQEFSQDETATNESNVATGEVVPVFAAPESTDPLDIDRLSIAVSV
jgi:hypothetical protein